MFSLTKIFNYNTVKRIHICSCLYLSLHINKVLQECSKLSKNKVFSVSKMSKENLQHLVQAEKQVSPVVLQLDTPEFRSIFSSGLKKLQEIFIRNNYEIRICGGAIRDLLLGNKPKDLDFATVATPDEMISMFQREDIRLINETGWGHGTVTCRLEEENFEITTLRIDTVTDGRRALVTYTKDWKVDASRRDLTFNSMFLTLDGKVIDFFNGYEDLMKRHVRFVGNSEKRIQEDYLRILRYFRFFGRIADDSSEFDQETLDVISRNLQGLNRISSERKHMELELIFKGNHVIKITKTMQKCGLFPFIGLPNNADLNEFEKIYNSSKHLNPHFMTYVTALLHNEEDLQNYRKHTKFSNLLFNIASFIIKHRSSSVPSSDLIAWYVDLIVDYNRKNKHKGGNAVNMFLEFLKYRGDTQALLYFTDFNVPRFPITGTVVKEKTGAVKKDVGLILDMLYKTWKASRYTLTEEELLKDIDSNTISKLKEGSL